MPVAEVDLGGALGDVVVSGPEDSGFSKVHAPAHLILTTTIKVRYCGRGTCFREKNCPFKLSSVTNPGHLPPIVAPYALTPRGVYFKPSLHVQGHMRQYVSAVRVVAAAEQTFREETRISVMVAFTHLDQCNMCVFPCNTFGTYTSLLIG